MCSDKISGDAAPIPPQLLDENGRLRYCAESRTLVAQRLLANPDAPLKKALRGLECLYDQLFQNLSFAGVSFITEDLSGMNFSGCNFDGAKFDQALVVGAVFRGARVRREVLARAADWVDAVAESSKAAKDVAGTEKRPAEMLAPLLPDWMRFSEAHHLPELMMLPPDLKVKGLGRNEERALRDHRLAIGVRPVLGAELAVCRPPNEAEEIIRAAWGTSQIGQTASAEPTSGISEGDFGDSMQPCEVNTTLLKRFFNIVNNEVHGHYALPSAVLWKAVNNAVKYNGKKFELAELVEWVAGGGEDALTVDREGMSSTNNPAATFASAPFRVVRIFGDVQ